jgi:hypothetical protein
VFHIETHDEIILSDSEIATVAAVDPRDLKRWRNRDFMPARTGGLEDVAIAYVLGVLSELGIKLSDASWVASRVVPELLGDAPPQRLTVSVSKRVCLILNVAEMANELGTRIAEAQQQKDARRVA